VPRRQGRNKPQGGESSGAGVSTDWRWVLTPAAERQLRRLSAEVQHRITRELDLLAAGSPTVDTRKLELAGEDAYRLRIGNYRVLFTIDKAAKTFVLSKIADRKDVYR
jgi:mRNA interferase RelE/StbE